MSTQVVPEPASVPAGRRRDGGLSRPLRAALLVGGLNLVVSVAWILGSGAVAARLAPSVEALALIEKVKGLAFVLALSLLMGTVTWVLQRRLARQQEVVARQQAALLASEGRALASIVAASVAHDMNNLLAIASGQVQLIRMDGPADERIQNLEYACGRLTELSRRLQAVGRAGAPVARERFDLATSVREAAGLVSRHVHVRGCEIDMDVPAALPFEGSEALVLRIVTNLVLNAGEATQGKGRLRVRLRREPDAAVIDVDDDGPGVPAELRADVLEPFFTTKPGGTGLGLVSVRAAAEEMGGRLEVHASDLGGARFRVRIPLPPHPEA